MKIAVYHNTDSGGARRAVHEMTRGLAGRGHTLWEFRARVGSGDDEFLPPAPHYAGARVWNLKPAPRASRWTPLLTPYLDLGTLLVDLRRADEAGRQAAGVIEAMGFDLVLAHDCAIAENPYVLRYLSTPNVFYCHHGAGRAIPPRPFIRSEEGRFARLKGLYYAPAGWLSRYARVRAARVNARSAGEVWTNSYFARECLYAVHAVESSVVPLGVDAAQFRPLDLPREKFVLAVGALHPRKGHEFLLRSMGAIPERVRPRLVIAAHYVHPPYRQQLDRLARQLNVDYVLQPVSDDDELVRLYNQALALVFAPVMEPFGLVILEAMACGTPVVAVREGGAREIVLDGTTGLLTDRHPVQFAAAVGRLIQDGSLRQQLGDAGVACARAQWSWERTVDQVEGRFQDILSGPS
jgi:glycosyltransferase involved in cell wall biosynthesis